MKAGVWTRAALAMVILGADSAQAQKLAKSPKPPKPPYQEAIKYECVTVYNIQWSSFFKTITGDVENGCQQPASVFIRVAYFGRGNLQVDSDIVNETLASGARWKFQMKSTNFTTRTARIIEVSAHAR